MVGLGQQANFTTISLSSSGGASVGHVWGSHRSTHDTVMTGAAAVQQRLA